MEPQETISVPEEYRQAIRLASSLLIDDIQGCIMDDAPGRSLALEELPPGFRLQIEKDLPRWVVAFSIAGAKLVEDRPQPPSCVAEEITMHVILSFAVNLLAEGPEFGLPSGVPREKAEDFRDDLENVLFLDQDFLLLYEGWADGIGGDPDEPIGQMMGMVNLAYKDWFRAFSGHEAHPYHDETPQGDPEEPEDDEGPF